MKKLVYAVTVVSVAFGLAGCNLTEQGQKTSTEGVVTEADDEADVLPIDSINAGSYEFNDEVGKIWVLNLNADSTASMYTKGRTDSGAVFYGTWEKWNSGRVRVEFADKIPQIWVRSGNEMGAVIDIADGYVYVGNMTLDKKNPRRRLPIKKL
ncbi:MAG: hypothetical protein J1E63_02120 [Muribaculaceae bacterium]|nr:hypothetical protein [Muribaculaceae bacterium]